MNKETKKLLKSLEELFIRLRLTITYGEGILMIGARK